jgi:cysteine desulfurase
MNASVYLDHNATSPLRPEAEAAMVAAMQRCGNPSSIHRHGRVARRFVDDARELMAALFGCEPAGVVFTSGGTEANALALRGCGRARVLASAVEHASVLFATSHVERVPVDGDGVIRLDALAGMLAAGSTPAVVSVMLANNETGVIQPIGDVADIARQYGALVHCDAVQAAGKLPLDARTIGADLLSISAHKLGGPAGVGALIVAPGVPLAPEVRGGGQERGRRAGSENIIGIAGFAAAAEQAVAALQGETRRLGGMRDAMERRLLSICPGIEFLGRQTLRLPNTSCIAMPHIPGSTQVIAFDLAGISLSAGAACSSGKVSKSHVLAAMQVGDDLAARAVRVSLGWSTIEADVRRLIEAWIAIYAQAAAGGQLTSSAAAVIAAR